MLKKCYSIKIRKFQFLKKKTRVVEPALTLKFNACCERQTDISLIYDSDDVYHITFYSVHTLINC